MRRPTWTTSSRLGVCVSSLSATAALVFTLTLSILYNFPDLEASTSAFTFLEREIVYVQTALCALSSASLRPELSRRSTRRNTFHLYTRKSVDEQVARSLDIQTESCMQCGRSSHHIASIGWERDMAWRLLQVVLPIRRVGESNSFGADTIRRCSFPDNSPHLDY